MPDLRLALRTLLKTPFVTLVAVVSLALGIGANAGIYSLFYQLLLSPLPVQSPYDLVNLAAPGVKPGSTSCNTAGSCDDVFSYPMFRDLERQQTSFTGLAAHRVFGANLAFKGRAAESSSGTLVSGSYFPLLGLRPALGRLLGPGDDQAPGQSPVVVLSHRYWRKTFNEDPSVLNQALTVNGEPMTIVGVAPDGFDGTTLGPQPSVFVPITMRDLMEKAFASSKGPTVFENRRSYWVYVFGRLKPGVTVGGAETALNMPYRGILNDVEAPLQKGMSDQTLKRFRDKEVTVVAGPGGQSSVRRESAVPMRLLLGVTGLVLLIACANIANLLLARAATRAGEMALRLAIGANRWHLVGQLLAESSMLALFGGAAGLLVARWTLQGMAALLPPEAARIVVVELNSQLLLFAAVVTLGTGLLFGLFPAIHSTSPRLVSLLRGVSGQSTSARGAARFRTSLATAQIALSMALLIAAGLFIHSLVNVSRVDLGLKADHVVTFAVSPQLNGYKSEQSKALFERLERELAAEPGVTGVTGSMVPILAGNNWGNSVIVQGFDAGPDTDTDSRFNAIGPGYFKTLGVPMLAGREFTNADAVGTGKVAVVNEEFARKFHLGNDAVGKRMGRGAKDLDIEIVGLVQNVKYSEVKAKIPPVFYTPYRQDESLGFLTFYVKTSLDPDSVLGAVPRIVKNVDPNLPVEDLAIAARADSAERLPRPVHHHAVHGLCRHRHAAGGHRPLRRPGLHGGAADPGDRPSNRARRHACRGPSPDPEAGRVDDARRGHHWSRRSGSRREGRGLPGSALRAQGLRPGCLCERRGCPGRRGLWRGLPAGPPGIQGQPDGRAARRVANTERTSREPSTDKAPSLVPTTQLTLVVQAFGPSPSTRASA